MILNEARKTKQKSTEWYTISYKEDDNIHGIVLFILSIAFLMREIVSVFLYLIALNIIVDLSFYSHRINIQKWIQE